MFRDDCDRDPNSPAFFANLREKELRGENAALRAENERLKGDLAPLANRPRVYSVGVEGGTFKDCDEIRAQINYLSRKYAALRHLAATGEK